MNPGEMEKPIEVKLKSSREEISADLIVKQAERKGVASAFSTEADALRFIEENKRVLKPGVAPEDVVAELKKMGIILPPPLPIKKVKTFLTPKEEFLSSHQKPTRIEDPEVLKRLEDNNFFKELERNEVFTNDSELDAVFEKSLKIGNEHSVEEIENEDYYLEFGREGLVPGGVEEVRQDLKELAELEAMFKEKNLLIEKKNKKVATIVEQSVVYGISKLHWFGQGVSVERASRWDDVKRKIDAVIQIKKAEDASSFLALGVDVTYSGISSERYRAKLNGLLASIRHGEASRMKYFRDSDGTPMREFAVPKIILFFDLSDVKELVYMIKKSDDPAKQKEFENSKQKVTLFRQIMTQCRLLATYARRHKQPAIAETYEEVVSSITRLADTNPEIQELLIMQGEDEVTIQMQSLIR